MLRTCSLIAAVGVLQLLAPSAIAQTSVGPHNRAEAVKIIADLRRIVSPGGLQAIETVKIGGIDQLMSIRSQDLRNPVLIYFHGGPGCAVEMPLIGGGIAAWTSISPSSIGISEMPARPIPQAVRTIGSADPRTLSARCRGRAVGA